MDWTVLRFSLLTAWEESTRSKTGAQSSAETRKSGLAASTSARAGNGIAKPHTRTNSFASSASSRTTSTSSRTNSNGLHSATVGPGTRPPGYGIARPQTSLSGIRKPTTSSGTRPATSMDMHEEESPGSVLGKRKGTPSFHSSSLPNLTPQFALPNPDGYHNGIRGYTSNVLRSRGGDRDSLCSAMSDLSLGHKLNPVVEPTHHTHEHVTQHARRFRSPNPVTCFFVTPSPSPPKHRTPLETRKRIVPFLTKDSNTKAWDHDNRVREIDQMCETLLAKMSQAGQSSFGLKETVDIYKSRSK